MKHAPNPLWRLLAYGLAAFLLMIMLTKYLES